MLEDSGEIGRLGKSVTTWQKQSYMDKRRSFKLIKANISRMGLKAAVEKEDLRLAKEESSKLHKINDQVGSSQFSLPTAAPASSSSMYNTSLPPLSPLTSGHFAPSKNQGHGSALPLLPHSSLVTPLELIRYRTVFNMLDVDGHGTVSCEQIMRAAKAIIGRQPTQSEVREFMDNADANSNELLEFDEFVVVMQRTKRALGRPGSPRDEFSAASEARKREKYRQVGKLQLLPLIH